MFSKTFARSVAAAALAMGNNPDLKYFQQDEDYHQQGLENVRQTYDLLIAPDWKTEKITKNGDIISSVYRENLGKIYKLRCHLKYPAKALCRDFVYEVEAVPSWNPTLLESAMIKKINSYTDITYQVTAAYLGGLIKSRDFINLRCCRLVDNGKLCDDHWELDKDERETLSKWCESVTADMETTTSAQQSSILDQTKITENNNFNLFNNRSILVEANDITEVMHRDLNKPIILQNIQYPQAEGYHHIDKSSSSTTEPMQITNTPDIMTLRQGRVWINATSSVEHDKAAPTTSNYIRGNIRLSAFVMHEVEGKPNECIFEWVVYVDLKGNIPRYILNRVSTSNMQAFARHLHKYVEVLYHKCPILSEE